MGKKEAKILISMPLEELMVLADGVRKKYVGSRLNTCGVINAKSGRCSEDCRFCAQSAHHSADIETYDLKSPDEIVAAAIEAGKAGASRFGIVTSGNRLTREEIGLVAGAIRGIKAAGVIPCASLGALDVEGFSLLKAAGLSRYHHNIETSERFYPNIVTTHGYDERVSTIKEAKRAGLEVCSGGIIGLGEDWDDRLDMAFLLKSLGVDSVPLNFLVPIKGTPMAGAQQVSPADALRAIAVFRVIMKGADVRVAAGREGVLKDSQSTIYNAGANGMMVGGYLTIAGRSIEDDRVMVEEVRKSWSVG
jgi:biotin synthase